MEENQIVEPAKKKSPLGTILLCIVLIALGLGVGFYVGKTMSKGKETTKEETKQEEKNEEKKEEESKKEEPAPKDIKADYVIEDNTGKKFYIRIVEDTKTTPNYSITTTYYVILNDQEEELDKILISQSGGSVYLAVDTKEETLGRKYEVATAESEEYTDELVGKYILYKNGNGEVVGNDLFYFERSEDCTYTDYKLSIENGKVVKKVIKKYDDFAYIMEIGSAC